MVAPGGVVGYGVWWIAAETPEAMGWLAATAVFVAVWLAGREGDRAALDAMRRLLS